MARLSQLTTLKAFPTVVAVMYVFFFSSFPPSHTKTNTRGNKNKKKQDKTLFLLGDERANLHPVLLSLHVIFVREHNRVVNQVCPPSFLHSSLTNQN